MHEKQTNVILQTDNGLVRIDMKDVDKIRLIAKGTVPISELVFENGTTQRIFESVEALAEPYLKAHGPKKDDQSAITQSTPLCFS